MNSTKAAPSPLVTSAIISSRYLPVWIAIILLTLVAWAIAPGSISRASFTTVLPFTAFLAITALGQMIVIMTGGIDLSVPSVVTLTALVTAGVSKGLDENLFPAIAVALAVGCVVGLANGFLVAVLKLNPLIVTLAVGQLANGAANAYWGTVVRSSSVPKLLSDWAIQQFLGVGWIFWASLFITLGITLLINYTSLGRRFQAVGANPLAAWIAGIRVNSYILFAYVGAALLYGLCGVLLAGFVSNPNLNLGAAYLLGPIAAVVIGGASLKGGLASPISTVAAALFLTLLNQMLRVLGFSSNLQFVFFGLAIIAGMVLSGDRIITIVERLLQGGLRAAQTNPASSRSEN